jgi:hypothetical protein
LGGSSATRLEVRERKRRQQLLDLRCHEDGEVHDAVLFGANELLAIDDQGWLGAPVDDAQFGDHPVLRYFRHFHQSRRQGVVQDLVTECRFEMLPASKTDAVSLKSQLRLPIESLGRAS